MDDAAEGKRAKDRSPTFPFISLEQALERARQFYNEEKRGTAPYARAVLHWKYSAASSGALQTAAALKNYGLLNELGGSGAQRQLQLSELALRILLDTRPDSSERDGYVRQAALAPAVVRDIYAEWPAGLPSDSTLNHYLVLDKRFNEATARRVVQILKENQQFARLDGNQLPSQNEQIHTDSVVSPFALTFSSPSAEKIQPQHTMQPKGGGLQIAFVENLLTDDGEPIAIHFPAKPTASLYAWISEYAAFRAERLAKIEKVAAAMVEAGGDSKA